MPRGPVVDQACRLAWLATAALCLSSAAEGSTAEADWFFEALPDSHRGRHSLAHTEKDAYTLYEGLWWHNGRLYGLTDPAHQDEATRLRSDFTYNLGIVGLPTRNITGLLGTLKTGLVAGTTLALDLAFPAFPENMGHWTEALLPVFNVLGAGAWRGALPAGAPRGIDTLLFVNILREQLAGLDWVWEMLRLVLAPGLEEGGPELPRVLFFDELDNLDKAAWLGFERLLVAQDRYARSDGAGGFASTALGARFRAAAYARAGVAQGPGWGQGLPPRTLTLLSSVGGEEVLNRGELSAALADVGEALGLRVRPYTVTSGASFSAYVAAMARTGVLVARHGPLLANTMFLPPGALVLELVPYNWAWRDIAQLYVNITRSLGDVHHVAWRARDARWAVYKEPHDDRYAHWSAKECASTDCLEVHARAGLIADTATIQETLLGMLPAVLGGHSVEAVLRRWGDLDPAAGTGLWWDKR